MPNQSNIWLCQGTPHIQFIWFRIDIHIIMHMKMISYSRLIFPGFITQLIDMASYYLLQWFTPYEVHRVWCVYQCAIKITFAGTLTSTILDSFYDIQKIAFSVIHKHWDEIRVGIFPFWKTRFPSSNTINIIWYVDLGIRNNDIKLDFPEYFSLRIKRDLSYFWEIRRKCYASHYVHCSWLLSCTM